MELVNPKRDKIKKFKLNIANDDGLISNNI